MTAPTEQEVAYRFWWDNHRDQEIDAIGPNYPERLAFRAGWNAALALLEPKVEEDVLIKILLEHGQRLLGVSSEDVV